MDNTSNNINSKLKLTGKNNNIYSLRSYILLFFLDVRVSAPSGATVRGSRLARFAPLIEPVVIIRAKPPKITSSTY